MKKLSLAIPLGLVCLLLFMAACNQTPDTDVTVTTTTTATDATDTATATDATDTTDATDATDATDNADTTLNGYPMTSVLKGDEMWTFRCEDAHFVSSFDALEIGIYYPDTDIIFCPSTPNDDSWVLELPMHECGIVEADYYYYASDSTLPHQQCNSFLEPATKLHVPVSIDGNEVFRVDIIIQDLETGSNYLFKLHKLVKTE